MFQINQVKFLAFIKFKSQFDRYKLRKNSVVLEHVYMRPEVNSNRFEISLRGKISIRCKVTSLFAFT